MSEKIKNKFFKYINNNEYEKLDLLLKSEIVDVNVKDENNIAALHCVADKGFENIATLLLIRQDIDVNIKNDREQTPLIYVAANGNINIAKLFLSHKNININDQDQSGYAPIHYAILNMHDDIAQLLLEHEIADLAIQNKLNQTPLYCAAFKGAIKIVKFLLNHKNININCKDLFGNTPFHGAADQNQIEAIYYFVEHGADIFMQNNNNETPLDLAIHKNHTSAIHYLQNIQELMKNSWQKVICKEVDVFAKISMLKRVYRTHQFKALMEIHIRLNKINTLHLFKPLINECKFLTWDKKEIKQLRSMGLPLTKNEYEIKEKLLAHIQNNYKTDLIFEFA